ncbi:hypothetical protein MUK42_19986 [Musa troglodytarum]|uniref:Uncharacterized protein n=1 Tax=Musa troglodytarum TaxID=320322 RepID=A0A9E7FWC8_9LILI|nr:hypothetical protein MUK42_19986 [Musa troglodytarum]
MVPSVLPIQPRLGGVGQHHVGPRRVARPRALALPPPCRGPRPLVRRQRRLDRLRHHPPRRPPGHDLHRGDHGVGAGAEPRVPGRPGRPAAGPLGQVRVQPGDRAPVGDRPQGLPRSHHGLVCPHRLGLACRHRVEERLAAPRRGRAGVPDDGLRELRAPPGRAPLGDRDGDVGVRGLLPGVDRVGGGAGHVGGIGTGGEARAEGEHG